MKRKDTSHSAELHAEAQEEVERLRWSRKHGAPAISCDATPAPRTVPILEKDLKDTAGLYDEVAELSEKALYILVLADEEKEGKWEPLSKALSPIIQRLYERTH